MLAQQTQQGMELQPLLKQEEAARLLSISTRTLEAWRNRGGGPRYIRISARCIRYRVSDLEEWQAGLERVNTSLRYEDV